MLGPTTHAHNPPAIVRTACPAHRYNAECGFVQAPLDRRLANGRTIRIYFELYRRSDAAHPAASTVLSIEGGPGFSTTADRAGRLALWRPVRAHRDLLLVDLRGTGRSGALDCPAFRQHLTHYIARAALCASQLGPDRQFYDTSQSVQDLALVLRAVHAGKVDVYGDSYGSYAAQAFAVRYPGRLRSLTLDGTYQLPGTDPALADIAASTRSGLQLACARRPPCLRVFPRPLGLLTRLVQRARAQPFVGTAPDGDGDMVRVTVNEDALVQLMMSGYYDPGVWRDVLAATHSAFAGDTRPLLRLVAETITTDGGNGPARDWSESLYLSVICHDYPELWPAGTPVGQRPAMVASGLAGYPAGTFAPFSAAAWTGTNYEGALACEQWPASPASSDPPVNQAAPYPHVPTLVLNGDQDNITPLADARVVAGRFPDSTLVVMQNSGHVTAEEDQNDCASVIYEHFVRSLKPGDTSCAQRTPEQHVVMRFPLRLSQVAPAVASAGDRSTQTQRRVASAAAQTVADALERWWVNGSGSGVGLRGGQWSYSGSRDIVYHLRNAMFVPGVAVTGTIVWHYYTGPVVGTVVAGWGGHTIRLHLRWNAQARAAVAQLDGTVGGRPIRLHMLAP
jgi:pimeloyl-ACP methyl ester carboxylesterase